MKKQSPTQIVYIDDWDSASEYENIFPKGSKAKRLLYCPDKAPFPFLIPGHYYMFKKPPAKYPHQFWIEIVAYYLGDLMHVPVPPAFVAFSEQDKTYGVLIEWFYDFPSGPKQHFTEGGDWMKRLIKDYDSRRGTQHNFVHITALLKTLTNSKSLRANWKEHWAKIFTFDTIIGNRDRHHENWGLVITHFENNTGSVVTLSPAYDNESSLGHEILERNINKFEDKQKISKYINSSKYAIHHMRWDISADKSQFANLVERYIKEFPETETFVLSCLDFDIPTLVDKLAVLKDFDIAVPLTEPRVHFMIKLIEIRRKDLLSRIVVL